MLETICLASRNRTTSLVSRAIPALSPSGPLRRQLLPQLEALKAWGTVTGERYKYLEKILHRTLVVNGRHDLSLR